MIKTSIKIKLNQYKSGRYNTVTILKPGMITKRASFKTSGMHFFITVFHLNTNNSFIYLRPYPVPVYPAGCLFSYFPDKKPASFLNSVQKIQATATTARAKLHNDNTHFGILGSGFANTSKAIAVLHTGILQVFCPFILQGRSSALKRFFLKGQKCFMPHSL